MRKPAFFLLCFILSSCIRDTLFPGTPRFSHENGRPGHGTDSTDIIPPGPHVYLTAVRFPDGFAWEEDTCAVDGPVWIDLYRDGRLVRSIPAGSSIHADMHRFRNGRLYTDFSSGEETVVCQDGLELFRFPGREALRGFLVREDGVHTLGQDRDGNGFTYRIDGRAVFRSEAGLVCGDPCTPGRPGGALTEEDEWVFYAYGVGVDGATEYYILRNGELYKTLPKGSGGTVRDIQVIHGNVYRIRNQTRVTVLESDERTSTLPVQGRDMLVRGRIVPLEKDVLVLGAVASPDGTRRCFLFSEKGNAYPTDGKTEITELVADGGVAAWMTVNAAGQPLRLERSDGNGKSLPGNVRLISGHCMLLREGHAYLALTGRNGKANRLWVDGEETEIPFNGYFTSVTVE